MEKRGRSPSFRRRNSIEQQGIINPEIYAILEQRKLLTSFSAEHKKVPIYSKHTVSSILYAQNVKRVSHSHSFDKTKSPRQSVDKPPISLSKVMPSKTKSNEDNLPSSYTKPSSPKPENTKKPHPRNYVNVVENNVRSRKQPTKGFGSKTGELLSSKDDHNLTTYEECDKITLSETNDVILIAEDHDNQHLVMEDVHDEMKSDQKGEKNLQCELLVPICLEGNADHHMPQLSNIACPDPINVTVVESVNDEHLIDHNDETFDAGGDHLIACPNVDKENQKAENEQVAPDQVVDVGSKLVVEVDDQEQRKRKESNDVMAPNKEDLISKMVAAYQQQVVAHGKKDIATYNNSSVTEETISKLREQRSNKVKALVGAFESAISHDQYDVLPKKLLRTHQ
uniref:uncharacterized protein LOC122610959 n=1 Tax=Erigeron canadensis TaxID=72917 RepID=UPI001CB897E7|nr:uncharacterized protein LOC122610959 [Erigeron canadensis]